MNPIHIAYVALLLLAGASIGFGIGYPEGYNARKTEEARTALKGPGEGALEWGLVVIYGGGGAGAGVAHTPGNRTPAPDIAPYSASEGGTRGPVPANPGSKFRGVLREPGR